MRLDQDVADLVVLGVSQENACRFCYAAVRALLWSQGMSRARVQHVEQELTRADLPPRTAAAIAFGRSQSRSGPPGAPAARDALLRAGFGADEMKEIAFAAGITDFSNRVHTIPAIPSRPIERIPDQLHWRLFRPLIRRLIRRSRQRGKATPLDRVPPYPYIRLVQAYAGSPIGPALGRTLEGMWASPHLPRRCKLLMLAVVARGLACEVCALEVGEALQREGLSAATVAQVLTHLDASELDPVERLLGPWCSAAPGPCATGSPARSSSKGSEWRPWPTGSAGWAPWSWITHDTDRRRGRAAGAPGHPRRRAPSPAATGREPPGAARRGDR
jgi:AhpD family alkylhydroperoxidase